MVTVYLVAGFVGGVAVTLVAMIAWALCRAGAEQDKILQRFYELDDAGLYDDAVSARREKEPTS